MRGWMEWTPDATTFRCGLVSCPRRPLPADFLSYWRGIARFSSTTSEKDRHSRTPNRPRCATIARGQTRPGGRAGGVARPSACLGRSRFQPRSCTRPLLVLVKETPRFSIPSRKIPSTVVYRFIPAADTPVRCQTTIGMVAGGDCEQHPLLAACFCPDRFLAIISLSSSRDRRVPRR